LTPLIAGTHGLKLDKNIVAGPDLKVFQWGFNLGSHFLFWHEVRYSQARMAPDSRDLSCGNPGLDGI
jgi:hypothetical protein